ncbi:hypothetical protein [Nostoc sp.]
MIAAIFHCPTRKFRDYESLSQADKLRLTKPIMKRLINPEEKAAIHLPYLQSSLVCPRELVSYSSGEFTLNITIEELLRLSLAVANAVGGQKDVVKPTQQELAQAANIARLEEELKFAKSGRGFGNGDR